MNDPESWLRRFRPRGPRAELKDAILERSSKEPERPDPAPRLRPWLDWLALVLVAAAAGLDVSAEDEASTRLRLDRAAPSRTRAEKEAQDFVRSQGIERPELVERLVSALAHRPRGPSAFAHVAIDAKELR